MDGQDQPPVEPRTPLCPLCGVRPVEAAATVVWVRGRVWTREVFRRPLLGCVPCLQSALLAEAAKSLFLGWFSLSALALNPIFILFNLSRAIFLRPRPDVVAFHLARRREASGAAPVPCGGSADLSAAGRP
ncbi:MAG: hypothetical protein GC160_16365 [Acidobacteria bacterium]|nr:hypothetical protein [Acidobacteriota bacterium]